MTAYVHDFDVAQVLAQLTFAEKIALCSGKSFWQMPGIERLGIPSVYITDGPHGVRKQRQLEGVSLENTIPSTCFPTASALASTWDCELVQMVGGAIGAEARALNVSVVLGPGTNIKRSPLGGRNFEYFSEDPLLSSQMSAAWINGVQSQQVGASLKHFAANNQESRRMTIDTLVDERALREIYLASFEGAIKTAQPWTVMCAYNLLNGESCSQHSWLLTEVLRNEWGFTGLVVSDWGAVVERAAGIAAGMDLEMPGNGNANGVSIRDAIDQGTLTIAQLDAVVTRVLTLIKRSLPSYHETITCDWDAHHVLARRVAAAGIVLLKNDHDVLPLQSTQQVAVIGSFAKAPRYQGAGSSYINPTRLDTVYDMLVAHLGRDVEYAAGYHPRAKAPDAALIAEAVALAKRVEVVVLVVGLPDIYEAEGIDRTTMALPASHDALVTAVVAANPRTVVVLCNGAPVEMPWHDQTPAIVEAYLGGQAGGGAIVDVLYGVVNPSGKLAETIPMHGSDCSAAPFFPGDGQMVVYRESIYVGYRYYDTADVAVRYPFGHGQSYTSFAYGDVVTQIQPDGNVMVTLSVTNTGNRAGHEVVQVYVRDVAARVFRPAHELKAFTKVYLEAGATTTVQLTLDARAFAFYDVASAQWLVEAGEFEIQVGSSSRDIRGRAVVTLVGVAAQPQRVLAGYSDIRGNDAFNETSFAQVYGKPLTTKRHTRGNFTINTPISDMATHSWIARALHNQMRRQMQQMIGAMDADGPTALLFRTMADEMPPRTLMMFAQGKIKLAWMHAFVALANRKYLQALRALIRG
jgi:beta-glucosidase